MLQLKIPSCVVFKSSFNRPNLRCGERDRWGNMLRPGPALWTALAPAALPSLRSAAPLTARPCIKRTDRTSCAALCSPPCLSGFAHA
jgi:hypothetical protein